MGLFSFIKDKLDNTPPTSAEIIKHLSDLGLTVNKLGLTIEGHMVKISGWTADVATKEKVIIAVGNMDDVESVTDWLRVGAPADPAATPPQTEPDAHEVPTSVFYTVKKGDTLSAIAKAQYGNANAYMQIFEANKPMLKHPDKIYPGQVLRIPQK